MHSSILIDTTGGDETRILVLEGGKVQEFKREAKTSNRLAGNIYLARIDKIEPSIQAAFVNIGTDKHGFLPFRAIHPDYYNIDINSLDSEPTGPEEASTGGADADNSNFLREFEDYTTDFGIITRTMNLQAAPGNQIHLNGHGNKGRNKYHRRTSRKIPRDLLIQDVITKGQIVLVQVSRDELNAKGATLTTYISLPSRYCVLLPNSDKGFSISSKINSVETSQHLRSIFNNFNFPQGAGLIMRTINAIPPGEVIEADISRQVDTWKDILAKAVVSKAPILLKPTSDLIETTIRDYFRDSINEIIVAGNRGYERTVEVVNSLVPHESGKVIKHNSLKPLFVLHGVHEDLRNLYNPRVELASGGHLIIQPTEALVSIDVNSAKSNQGKTLSETALKTNIEAAREIARQLRLRDLAGIIVIDFIDMEYQPHRKEVETALRTALQRDQAWINCGYISKLGLLEMTRQRAGENLATNTTRVCPACSGTGRVILDETLAVIILRHIEAECSLKKAGNVMVSVSAPLENYFLNEMRREISRLEDVYGCRIRFEATDNLFSQEYSFILYSADKNKEIFRYPPKYLHNNHNTPKPTWSSKKANRNSSKTGSTARSYNGNTKVSDENNSKRDNNSSNAAIDQIPTHLTANKDGQITSEPENDRSIGNTSKEFESASPIESEQGDVGPAVGKTNKEEKSSKPVKRKGPRTKDQKDGQKSRARQNTPKKETKKGITENESTSPSKDKQKESIKADTLEKSVSKVAKTGSKTVKQRRPAPKKRPVSKKTSQDEDSSHLKSQGNNEFENTINQIAPGDENDWGDIRTNLSFYSPSDLE